MQTRNKISTKLIVSLSSLVSIGLVIFIAITANYYITRMSENNTQLYNAYQVSESVKAFRAGVVALDGNQKRYMLTGNVRNLEEYQLAETKIKTQLKTLEKYFDNKAEEKIFERLKDQTYKKLAEAKELQQTINAGQNNNPGNSTELQQINETIEEITSILSAHTQLLITKNAENLNVSKKWNLLEIAIGVLVALAAVIILFRDINLRNQLEAELRNAKKQAEENATLKEQFMANVSHEIRTPMNAILGFSDLLNKTGLNNTQREYLNAISTSSSNLLNIINDILDFSKIEAGKLIIEKIPFNLDNTLNSLHLLFNQKAFEKGVVFNITKEQNLPVNIFGDPTRLNQILVNLIGNAIKFTPSGSVTLSCELKGIEHDVAGIVFRVKDTGIGIPQDKLQTIFERFNQGNKETTRKFGGTGLGLAIVKSLVEIQNGNINVKSKEGLGTEFIVSLSYPLSYQENNFNTNNFKSLPKIATFNKQILLVEDNILNQKLALNYLQEFGLNAHTADNGEKAIALLKENKYHLVLMDIQMPVMDGYTTTLKIRNELALKLPVIAMTAHVIKGEIEKCYQHGMNDYISKPFRETEFYEILKKHLGVSDPTQAVQNNSVTDIKQEKSETTGIVQINELQDLSRGNKTFIREMISIFSEQNPRDISEISNAIASADFDKIRATAHRMKTSIGFMGMPSLSEPLNTIELLAEDKKNMEQINALFTRVEKDCATGMNELNEFLKTL